MRTILVVDDEPHARRAVALYLERHGFRVETARHGQDALEQLGCTPIDAVVTDLQMPGIDGRELCQRIRRELGPEPFIVVVTSAAGEESRSWTEPLENVAFMEKPLSLLRLLRTLHERFEDARTGTPQ